tara:strand:+ start:106 stop:513 length:408 start_codon:yes stop_codon:yes gene_type:complete
MKWKEIIKFDFGEAQGRPRGKKDLPKQFKNPHATEKVIGTGEKVNTNVPKSNIPTNKCDWWPECKNDADDYCSTCGYKACKQDYDDFDGWHPKVPMDGGGNPNKAFTEVWEDAGDEEMGERGRKDVGSYSTGKDW